MKALHRKRSSQQERKCRPVVEFFRKMFGSIQSAEEHEENMNIHESVTNLKEKLVEIENQINEINNLCYGLANTNYCYKMEMHKNSKNKLTCRDKSPKKKNTNVQNFGCNFNEKYDIPNNLSCQTTDLENKGTRCIQTSEIDHDCTEKNGKLKSKMRKTDTEYCSRISQVSGERVIEKYQEQIDEATKTYSTQFPCNKKKLHMKVRHIYKDNENNFYELVPIRKSDSTIAVKSYKGIITDQTNTITKEENKKNAKLHLKRIDPAEYKYFLQQKIKTKNKSKYFKLVIPSNEGVHPDHNTYGNFLQYDFTVSHKKIGPDEEIQIIDVQETKPDEKRPDLNDGSKMEEILVEIKNMLKDFLSHLKKSKEPIPDNKNLPELNTVLQHMVPQCSSCFFYAQQQQAQANLRVTFKRSFGTSTHDLINYEKIKYPQNEKVDVGVTANLCKCDGKLIHVDVRNINANFESAKSLLKEIYETAARNPANTFVTSPTTVNMDHLMKNKACSVCSLKLERKPKFQKISPAISDEISVNDNSYIANTHSTEINSKNDSQDFIIIKNPEINEEEEEAVISVEDFFVPVSASDWKKVEPAMMDGLLIKEIEVKDAATQPEPPETVKSKSKWFKRKKSN